MDILSLQISIINTLKFYWDLDHFLKYMVQLILLKTLLSQAFKSNFRFITKTFQFKNIYLIINVYFN